MQQSCTQCGSSFDIRNEDQVFYASMNVPEPACCIACRSQLRCMHRNERSLYKRTCDLCKKEIVAMYGRDATFPVYCQSCFFSDKWNPLEYGTAFDPARPFFDQYADLFKRVPHLGIINKQSQNSEYCNYAYANRNCYLTSGSHQEEDCLYEAYSTKNRDSIDFLHVYSSELVYECLFSSNCYRCVALEHCEDCTECHFSRDLKGCKHCLFCANLHQKEYCIANKQCTKEELAAKLASLNIHTWSGLKQAKKQWSEDTLHFPVRALYQVQCQNCTGGTLSNCKNMSLCHFGADSEDCAYGCQVDKTMSSMDFDYMGYDKSERCYQTIGCQGLFGCITCNACWHGSGLRCCQFCFSCNNCFGCASLQQKSNCILNREYSKEEYTKLVATIIERMKHTGEWGTFFPAQLTPFAYNESMAMDWFPLSREAVEKQSLGWRQNDEIPDVKKVIPAAKLPDPIDDIPDDVLNWAIQCERTQRPFKIVKQELAFYRKMRLPIPHLHPEERHRERLKKRHGRTLWKRNCMKCQQPIQTTYAPDRPEKVYCESCYLSEVY